MSNSEDFQDTGMTSVFYEGVNSERERILEAVEQWRNNLLNGEPYTNEELAAQRDGGYSDNFEYLIAIIKGDQK